MFLKQSTAQTILFGPCLDKDDGVTEETALTLAQADMRLSKDGAAFAQKSAAGNATHDSDGWYSTSLSATDTDTVGELILNVHQPANMLPVWMRFYVVEEAVYDDLFAASADPFTVMQSDVAAIHSQTTVIESDSVVISSDTAAIHSDTTIIASDLVIAASDAAAIHSDTTIIASDLVIVASDVVVLDAAISDVESSLVIVKSDLVISNSDTTQIVSDLVIVASDAAAIHSDTTIIASDLVIVGSDLVIVVSDTTAIHSQTTVVESDTVVISSDTAAIETGVNVTQISGDSTAADRLEAMMDGVITAAAEGTPSTTVIQTDLAETTDDHYNGRLVTFLTGNAAGEQTDITDYTGSTGTITVTALTTAPAAGDTMVIH